MNGQAPRSWQEGLTGGAEAFLRNFLMFKQMQAQKSQQLLQMAQTGMLPPEYIQSPEFAQAVGKGMWGRGGKPTQYQAPTQARLTGALQRYMAGEEVPAETQILLGISPEIAYLTPEQRAERARVSGGLQLSKAEKTASFMNFVNTMDAGPLGKAFDTWSAMTGEGRLMTDEDRQTLLDTTKVQPHLVKQNALRMRLNFAQHWMDAGLDYGDSLALTDSFVTGEPLSREVSDKAKALTFDIRLAKKADIKSATARAEYWDAYGTWMRARMLEAGQADPKLDDLFKLVNALKGMKGKEAEQLLENTVNTITTLLSRKIPGLEMKEKKEKKSFIEKVKEILTPTDETGFVPAGEQFAPPGARFAPTGETAMQTIPEPTETTPELLQQLYHRLKESKWDDERIRRLFEAEGYPTEGIPFEEK